MALLACGNFQRFLDAAHCVTLLHFNITVSSVLFPSEESRIFP